MTKIYEITDTSNDEVYYSCGFFSTLEKAKEEIHVDKVDFLQSAQSEDYQMDTLKFEVCEHDLDKVSHRRKMVFSASFEREYDEEKEEDIWKEIEQILEEVTNGKI